MPQPGARLHWPRAAERLAGLRRLRPRSPVRLVPAVWRARPVGLPPRALPRTRRLDGPRLSWLFVIGGFSALASLLLFWVGMTVVRSVTEPIQAQMERDIVVAQPAPVVAQPAPVAARPTVASPATPLLPRIGQAVDSAGVRLTVGSVVKRSTHAGSAAAPGKTILVASVVLASGRQAATSYGPSGFRLRDADGKEQAALIPSADDRQSLKGGVLVNGDFVRGTVAFEVPLAADGFVLGFEPDEVVADYAPIRIALGD